MIRWFALFALLTLVLSSCDDKKNKTLKQSFTRDLAEIDSTKKLIALTDNSSTSYFIYKGQPMGFEYELLSLYAKEKGYELEVKLIQDQDSIFKVLNRGEADLVAANLTVTKPRLELVDFTEHHLTTQQVLVQRLPKNYHNMWWEHVEDSLIRNILELENKEIWVHESSSFYDRLVNLSNEIGAEINIKNALGNIEMEALIKMVSQGEIEYTVADENIAKLNKKIYPNIDINTKLSFTQKIAWAVRKTSPNLLNDLNEWIVKKKKTNDYHTIYTKYFLARTVYAAKVTSEYSSRIGSISEYDDILKEKAKSLSWDWRLLASLIYQESNFDASAINWTGATGLMQVMPTTVASDTINLLDPLVNLHEGTKYLIMLNKLWNEKIEDSLECQKFVMASYNVGVGHILDARAMATADHKNPDIWAGNVDEMLILKSKPEYYTLPIVKHGYCRGSEPVNYVNQILDRYQHYVNLID